jgi:ATP-dependent Clp protease ATP-binding subunit ClpA/ATP-dependent Clp protease ATP-binding subunit ClpC
MGDSARRIDVSRYTFTVPIYQVRDGNALTWSTVGLGPYNASHRSSSRVKLQRAMTDSLRKSLATLRAEELDRFRTVPATELRRVFLDFGLPADPIGGGRRRFAATAPLVCEPRWTTGANRVLLVYHPLAEEHWFWLEDGDDLVTRAQSFFRQAWRERTEDDLELLASDGKDMLRSMSLSAETRSLLADLPGANERIGQRRRREPVLDRVGVDQTLRAIEETLPLGMPRRPAREQLALFLCGDRRRPTLVVGEPGVGKSTALNRWVDDLLVEDGYAIDPNLDRIHHVWRISGKRIIAGMKYLGDWERRCLDLLSECLERRAILWISDIHLFGRLGQTRQSDRSLADFFRGPISRGELVVVGECTPGQLARLADDAPSFAALFSRVHIAETTGAETMQMMMHEARRLEQRSAVTVSPFTYRSILELGAGVYPWSSFPGKALDLLGQLFARHSGGDREIRPSDVVALLSAQTGLPENLLTLEAPLDPTQVREAVGGAVLGQPDAVDAACDLISRVRAGVCAARRPLAVYLFTGPTGTGKTELAKCIAEYLYGDVSRLLRLDMSEYSGPDAPARLIGDRAEPSGQLTRRIREQPFSVVLLDEIEKAHRSALYLLLQLFDEGRLTDAAGETASFQNAVVVMTSNLGAQPTRPIGFGEETRGMMADIARAVRDFFPPELFNRIDRVVPFRPLSPEAAADIATKELAKLLARRGLTERNIFVYANRAVKDKIVAEAFDPRLGARTVKKYLEEEIGGLMAEQITRGGGGRMQVFRIFVPADSGARGVGLHVESLGEAEPEPARFPIEALFDLPRLRLEPATAAAAAELAAWHDPEAIAAAAAAARDSDRASELYYFIDRHRDQLARVAAELGVDVGLPHAIDPRGPLDRTATLKLLADARALIRETGHLAEADRHAVWIELGRVGQGRRAGARFEAGRAGLMEWLVDAYANHRTDWIDGFAASFDDGKRIARDDGDLEALGDALARRPRQLNLLVSGLFAADAFAGERGAHIWQPLSAEPEIVRVDVGPAPLGERPGDRLSSRLAAIAAFERALETGEAIVDNPQALTGAARSLRFRPPLRAGEVFAVEVEDFRSGFAGSINVTAVGDAIELMLINWRGREVLS